MLFSELSQYLQKLEQTSKRLEITDILTDLIKNLDIPETDQAINLTLGQLKAPFNSLRFNIADKMMIKTLCLAYNKKEKEVDSLYAQLGDLGTVAEELDSNNKTSKLLISTVYDTLVKIAEFEGTGSQDKKITELAFLISKLDSISTKYVIRMVLGTTRLGFTSLTVIDALSKYLNGDKSLKKHIEEKYNVHPDIGLIAKLIKENGLEGIENLEIEPGVPLMPQKAQRLNSAQEIIEKMETAWAEFKFDGTRVQLHMDRKKSIKPTQNDLFDLTDKIFVKTYTRNLDETTHQFPDIIRAASKQIDAESVILDGEAIGYDPENDEFLPFQETIQRKRKHGVKDIAKQIPLKFLVFDLLYLNGKSLLNTTLKERRDLLDEIIKEGEVIEIDQHLLTNDEKELENYFIESKRRNLEGLVVKNPNSPYQAGARSFSWVKLKRLDSTDELADTVDCVVLGYYFGKGARADFGIGGFLVGVIDKETNSFKTISKIGTGLKDEDWVYLKKECDKIKVDSRPANVEIKKDLNPDVWTEPRLVVTVRADEISKSPMHTAGYALRFPRLISFRHDKAAEDSNSVKEIKEIYDLQFSKN